MRAEVVVRMQFANCVGPQLCLWLWKHLVANKRHLWLNLSNIIFKRKDQNISYVCSHVPSSLFGDAVNSVVERFQKSAKKAAAFQKLLPRRTHISGAAEREQPQKSKQSVAYHAPPPK